MAGVQSRAMDAIVHWAVEALSLSVLLSAPALGAALAVGLVTGLLQAATQLQDPTLGFVPRLLAVFAALWVGGAWMGAQLLEFTRQAWTHLSL